MSQLEGRRQALPVHSYGLLIAKGRPPTQTGRGKMAVPQLTSTKTLGGKSPRLGWIQMLKKILLRLCLDSASIYDGFILQCHE